MQVFNFIGSHQKNSFTKQIVYELNLGLEKIYGIKYKGIYIDKFNSHIHMCYGCRCCFKTGICPLDIDSMNKIKENLCSSDIVIIATPIYMNSISSFTKIFFERLSVYSHLMRLSGKMGIIILTLENSMSKEVLHYIVDVLMHMGINIQKVILVKHKKFYRQQIEDTLRTFKNINKANYIYLENDSLEKLYIKCNYLFNNIVTSSYEKEWWSCFKDYSYIDYKKYLLRMETMKFNIDENRKEIARNGKW